MEEIKASLHTYTKTLDLISEYRMVWTKTVRKLIFETLNKVIKETGMDVQVGIEEKMEGMELVFLSQGKQPSGISEVFESSVKRPLMKEGGSLFYVQSYNGKISVGVALPSIENIAQKVPPTFLGVYDPHEVTEVLILGHVKQFIEKLTNWEGKDVSPNEIGFSVRKK